METGAIKHENIDIAELGNLTIEITEYRLGGSFVPDPKLYKDDARRKPMPAATASIRVDKQKLMGSATYFKTMFEKPWAEKDSTTITLKGVLLEGWKSSSLPVNTLSVSDLWHAIMASNKYEFDRKKLTPWIKKWYAANEGKITSDTKLQRQMLYPCYAFDHTAGFQELTKTLVYE